METLDKFMRFFEQEYKSDILENFRIGKKYVVVDFFSISKFDPELADDLLEKPEETIKIGIRAIGEICELKEEEQRKVEVQIINLPDSQRIRIQDVRSYNMTKLVKIEGIVKKSGKVHPRVTYCKFECPQCGNVLGLEQSGKSIKYPMICGCGRKGKPKIIAKRLVDIQRIQLEEIPELIQDTNAASQKVYCYLQGQLTDPSLVGKLRPGNRVILTGIIEIIPDFYRKDKDPQDCTMIEVIININHVETVQKEYEEIDISSEDEKLILEYSKKENLIELFVNSVAPTIYGHTEIKETLILQLLGGVTKHRADRTVSRGWFHILLCGDPSTAKTKLGSAIIKIAPKARQAVGGATSSSGMTATVVRDELSGVWELEAGAMVLAHKGLLFLDEMDKMGTEDMSSLHEGMEAGTITKTKAGINATLPAQTSILAVANPKYGRFDPYEPIIKQINLPPALFSRFDLVFVIRDKPDLEKDLLQTKHILKSHQKPMTIEPELSIDFVRKYLAYAKQKINPKWFDKDPVTGEAIEFSAALEKIEAYFIQLRTSTDVDGTDKSVAITYRQLDALVRLAEASAKMRLSNMVETQDADKAIKLVEFFMRSIGLDPKTGKIDIDIIHSGISSSKRSKIHTLKEGLKSLNDKLGKVIPLDDIILLMKNQTDLNESEVEDLLENMKRAGEIFEPKRGFISLVD